MCRSGAPDGDPGSRPRLRSPWHVQSPNGWTDPDCIGVEREEGQVQTAGGHDYWRASWSHMGTENQSHERQDMSQGKN